MQQHKQLLLKKAAVFAVFTLSLLKWLILSVLAGIISGAAVAGFIWLLDYICAFTHKWDYYYILMPAAFFISALTIKYLAPDAEGHGTEKVIKAVHESGGKIKLRVVPVKIFTTVLTVSCGGSAGKEGPSTQIGAGLSSFLSSVLRLSESDTKRLVICGMSAAFAAIFGTPLAAAVFAVEVLALSRLDIKNLLPAIFGALAGYYTARFLNVNAETYHITFPTLSALGIGSLFSSLSSALLAGFLFGLVGILTITAVKYSEKLSHLLKIYKPLKGLIGGVFLVLLTLILGNSGKNYLGMGTGYVLSLTHGAQSLPYDFVLKIIFTAVTLSFGGSGGILMPLMFIGAAFGNTFAVIFHFDISLFTALGMLGVLACCTNTPLACTLMGLELFGTDFAVLAAIVCFTAYIISGHRSVYPSQKIAESKITCLQLLNNSSLYEAGKTEYFNFGKTASEFLAFLKIKNVSKEPPKEKIENISEKTVKDNGILSENDTNQYKDS